MFTLNESQIIGIILSAYQQGIQYCQDILNNKETKTITQVIETIKKSLQ
jgi:hypothetical protein